MGNNRVKRGTNDFESWCISNNKQNLLSEWDYERNALLPSDYSSGSNQSVFWKCMRGHTWKCQIVVRHTSGCPFCANRRVWRGYNDLATTYPEIAKEWDYEKNGDLHPDSIVSGSAKRVWWICAKGHSFATSVSNRTSQNTGCAICSGKKMLKGFNDLMTINPDFVKEWDYEKNVDIFPDEVTHFSHKRIWWRCSKCNTSWCAPVDSRSRGHGCPKCSQENREDKRYATLLQNGESFSECFPELLEEWDYEKNNELEIYPDKVLPNSNKTVWWICKKCNNNWKSIINNRSKGVGCPICSRIIAKEKMINTLINERGSLGDSNSPLLLEWDYEKNDEITPYDVLAGSGTKVWWKCGVCGYSWKTAISWRRNRGCPRCTKEMHSSFQEQAIFYYISQIYPDAINGYTGLGYELDIYIPTKKTAIEYDGQAWHKDINKDISKNEQCENDDIFLYRVREEECPPMNNTEYLFCYKYELGGKEQALNVIIHDLCYRVSGEDIDIDISRDNIDILGLFVQGKKEKSLEILYPDMAKEWDYEKNKDIKPSMIMPNTNRKYWWRCSKGHSFKASPSDRMRHNGGCPYCSNKKVLEGYNDLNTINPILASEWNYEKNELTPHEIIAGSNRKFWWICKEGHEWQATANSRMQGSSCPYCAGKIAIEGINDLTITNPDLIKEWNYDRNALPPQKYKAGSQKKVWWKCVKGHEWEAVIGSRAGKQKRDCPFCAGRKVLVGFNDLATIRPNLAKEWCYEKNGSLKPTEVTSGSGKKVWWKCSICGNIWETAIGERAGGRGCPFCSGKRVAVGTNDLVTWCKTNNKTYILEEWDYDNNGGAIPEQFTFGSHKRIKWKCKNGHSWEAVIKERTKNNGNTCPECKLVGRRSN